MESNTGEHGARLYVLLKELDKNAWRPLSPRPVFTANVYQSHARTRKTRLPRSQLPAICGSPFTVGYAHQADSPRWQFAIFCLSFGWDWLPAHAQELTVNPLFADALLKRGRPKALRRSLPQQVHMTADKLSIHQRLIANIQVQGKGPELLKRSRDSASSRQQVIMARSLFPRFWIAGAG